MSRIAVRLGLVLATFTLPAVVNAAPLLMNGSFESGLTAWTVVDQAGGSGSWFSQSGTASPLNGFGVVAPPDGAFAAMTDQGGPGSHLLYQDFVVPVGVSAASLDFSFFFLSELADFFDPLFLLFDFGFNQQARVDIITTSADPFSVQDGDLLWPVLALNSNEGGYHSFSTDLTAFLQAHAGETLRLRFAEVDNLGFLNMGIDAVNLDVTAVPEAVPEPASLVLMGAGAAMMFRRRRARAHRS